MIEQYTALYSELDRCYSESISGPYQDLSSEGTVAALRGGQITGYWRPTVIVTDHLREIKRLWDISRDIVYLDLVCVSPAAKWLMQHGYSAEPYFTQVIDLEFWKWSGIRDSYKSIINNGKDQCRIEPNIMKYKELHRELSGRKTRSAQSWKIQQQQINANEAYLIMKNEDAGVFVMYNKHWAYYASGKSRGDSHALLWYAIDEAKRRGVKYFDVGEQVFFGNQKMVNISNFKRGFGGETKMRLLCKRKQV